MKNTGIGGLFIIGSILLFYVFTIGEIWNNHSIQMYLLLSVAILNFSLALLALAVRPEK